MINKEESIKRYLDAYLNKRWSIINDPYAGADWIIDVNNNYWIIKLEKLSHCYYRYEFFLEISELYDMKISDILPIMGEWVEEVLKRGFVTVTPFFGTVYMEIEEVLKRGVVIR